jgi:hypothetical protein
MDRRTFILAAGAALVPLPAKAESLVEFASRESMGSARTTVDKVRAAIAWTHKKLDWTSTDYVKRTPEQILERGGGNCYDQAIVVRALLEPAGVRTRVVREVNVQPSDRGRQKNAEAQVAKVGPKASVFGERHNDHAWTEYWNEESAEWTPADPTLNVLGFDGWVRARLGFGARPVHEIIPYADMLFPIAVLVPGTETQPWESRTDRYLVDAFSRHVPGVSSSSRWPDWVSLVRAADQRLLETFQNKHNFHQEVELISALTAAYEGLRSDVAGRAGASASGRTSLSHALAAVSG